jgi:hypothetical protein
VQQVLLVKQVQQVQQEQLVQPQQLLVQQVRKVNKAQASQFLVRIQMQELLTPHTQQETQAMVT